MAKPSRARRSPSASAWGIGMIISFQFQVLLRFEVALSLRFPLKIALESAYSLNLNLIHIPVLAAEKLHQCVVLLLLQIDKLSRNVNEGHLKENSACCCN